MNKLDLTALLERVRNATGPDRGLDRALFDALLGGKFWPDNGHFFTRDRWGTAEPIPLTSSIDAALALVERVLPVNTTRLVSDPAGCSCAITWWPDGLSGGKRVQANETHQSLVLSILTALLLALTSNQEGNDEA